MSGMRDNTITICYTNSYPQRVVVKFAPFHIADCNTHLLDVYCLNHQQYSTCLTYLHLASRATSLVFLYLKGHFSSVWTLLSLHLSGLLYAAVPEGSEFKSLSFSTYILFLGDLIRSHLLKYYHDRKICISAWISSRNHRLIYPSHSRSEACFSLSS